jgi:hypothetical protein
VILQELLDKPYPYKLDDIDGKAVEAIFTDDSGEEVTVNLEWWPGPNTYIVEFKRKGSWELTGDSPADKNIALRILSTVFEVLRKAVAKNKPLGIGFSSKNSEPSRVRLYDTIVKRYAAQLGCVRVTDLTKVDDATFRSWSKNMITSGYKDVTRVWLIRKDAVLP